jgi:putative SOS response-associated peptidase YedK
MCGRYMMTSPVEALRRLLLVEERPNLPPRYNIAPTQDVPIVRLRKDRSGRELTLARWGLIPYWAKDAKIGARQINARAESLATRPAFREAFARRRCLVPADGFYEWQKRGRTKQPWLIRAKDGSLLAFAGLWEHWRDPAGGTVTSCTIVTGEPNPLVARLHDRMPVILAPDHHEGWLCGDPATAQDLLRPFPADRLEAFPVSPRVNSPANDDPGLIEPIALQDALL